MKYVLNILITVILAVSLSGCIVVGGDHDWDDNSWEAQQRENREIISDLEIGTERSRVITRLGAPNFSEAFTKGEDEYRILFYRTQHRHSDGDTSKDETTPLIFKNNQLVGWGDETLATIRD